jgi:hypothetical protein
LRARLTCRGCDMHHELVNATLGKWIEDIQSALNTEETGHALVNVARAAHNAELELASWVAKFEREGKTLAQALEWARRS